MGNSQQIHQVSADMTSEKGQEIPNQNSAVVDASPSDTNAVGDLLILTLDV